MFDLSDNINWWQICKCILGLYLLPITCIISYLSLNEKLGFQIYQQGKTHGSHLWYMIYRHSENFFVSDIEWEKIIFLITLPLGILCHYSIHLANVKLFIYELANQNINNIESIRRHSTVGLSCGKISPVIFHECKKERKAM